MKIPIRKSEWNCLRDRIDVLMGRKTWGDILAEKLIEKRQELIKHMNRALFHEIQP